MRRYAAITALISLVGMVGCSSEPPKTIHEACVEQFSTEGNEAVSQCELKALVKKADAIQASKQSAAEAAAR